MYFRKSIIGMASAFVLAAALPAAALESTPSGQFRLGTDNLGSVKFRFRIDADPGDSSYIFWAQQFWFNNGSGGYLGMQRNAGVSPYKKMVLFSVWDTLAVKAGDMPYAKGEPFGGEGIGQHISAAFDWQVGHTYAFNLSELADKWWNVTITDESTGKKWNLGSIQALPSWQRLSSFTNNFTEVFINGEDCAKVPYARASFLPPVGNNGASPDLVSWRSASSYGSYTTCAPASKPGAIPGVNVGVSGKLDADGAEVHEVGLSNKATTPAPSAVQTWGENDRKAAVGSVFKYPHNGVNEYFQLQAVGSDGRYWYFPENRSDNYYWRYMGTDYNGVNALMHWGDNDRLGHLGDLYVYDNPYSHRTEYFTLKALGADSRYWYFPTDGTSNSPWWTFRGVTRPTSK